MLLFRIKIILLSILAMAVSSLFILWKVDSYNKEREVDLLRQQIVSTTQAAFDLASITGGPTSHTYDIINSIKAQKDIKDLWISRSDVLSTELGKPKTAFRDQIERNVYISKSMNEESLSKVNGTNNDHEARISIPVIANEKCVMCHANIHKGDVVGAVNASILLRDNIMGVINSMEMEFASFLIGASFLMMLALMFSVRSFTTLAVSIKTAILSAINGDFTQRAKSKMIGTDEIAKLINRLLESLDKNLSIIDTKIATIFIYNRLLYNKNPLIRLVEVINEVTNLFAFKNKIETVADTKEVYKEIQAVIQRYIKYKNLLFVELINNEVVSGYKIENNANMKITADEIVSIEKRLNNENNNVIFRDNFGSLFISTSNGGLNVIDLKMVVSEKIILYYSIALDSKKELVEKEKSITRIYNYMREARPIISNKLLLHEIEESSYTDRLTMAYNRFFIDRYLPTLKENMGKQVGVGILMLDIDHFKNINDTYGHAVGDIGIVLLVETIRKAIKPIDKLIRYGGEEFVVVIENCDLEEAERVAERIRTMFVSAKQCSKGELDFHKSVSIGVSAMPQFSKDIWECINQADLALYEAKEGGRNRVVKFSAEVKARDNAKKAKQAAEEKARLAAEAQKAAAQKPNNDHHEDDDDFLESLKLNNLI